MSLTPGTNRIGNPFVSGSKSITYAEHSSGSRVPAITRTAAGVNGHKHVLHILNTADRRGTGIAKIVRTLATRIESGYSTSVWFVYEDGPLVGWLQSEGVDAQFVPCLPSRDNPTGPLRLWNACRKARPDIVHHHSSDDRMRFLLRRAVRAPILLHLHGRAVETDNPIPAVISTRFADRVIAVARAVADYSRTPAETVYTGIETFENGTRDATAGPLRIGTVGRLVSLKGYDTLLSAMVLILKKRRDVTLDITGTGPDGERLQAIANDLGLAGSVRMLGWHNNIRNLMRGWDVFVQPSREEGLPHSLLEAMAECLPIVATSVGGIPELVVDGKTGWLVPRGDEYQLAQRLLELSEAPQARVAMGSAARERAEKCFSADVFASRIREIYDSMLSRPDRNEPGEPSGSESLAEESPGQ